MQLAPPAMFVVTVAQYLTQNKCSPCSRPEVCWLPQFRRGPLPHTANLSTGCSSLSNEFSSSLKHPVPSLCLLQLLIKYIYPILRICQPHQYVSEAKKLTCALALLRDSATVTKQSLAPPGIATEAHARTLHQQFESVPTDWRGYFAGLCIA